MKTFAELEKEYARIAVRTAAGKPPGAGVLTLDREKTLVTLSTKQMYAPRTDINGWFELKLRHGTQTIWLHNSLLRGQRSHGRRGRDQETDIFPNLVVFNAGVFDRSNNVSSVAFRFEKFGSFFIHEIVESQLLYKAPKDILRAIKRLRKTQEHPQYPREYDFYSPGSLYLVHRPPHILSFKVEDRKYDIAWGLVSWGPSWDSIKVKAEPCARITFARPVPIDEATDFVWAWRRLFSQLAMEHLDVTSLAVRGRRRKYPNEADVYLPNSEHEGEKKHDRRAFARGESPLSRWNERHALAKAMQIWLAKEEERRTFRVNIDRVIANLEKRTSLEDVVTLCSAIESLDELKTSNSITEDNINTIVVGARKAAEESKVDVDINRIRGVLDLLRHESLPHRLKTISRSIAPEISPQQFKMITTGTSSLRKIAAHGNSIRELAIPRVRPIVEALLGVCVLFDLLTSSFPAKANEHHRLLAFHRIDDALLWLSSLDTRSKAST